jgi:starvation-inducible DNA-binding protein
MAKNKLPLGNVEKTKNPGVSAPIAADKSSVKPLLHQQQETGSRETQRYGEVVARPHGLDADVAKDSVEMLNQCLADTITLRDMYKKHHWQVTGPTFNELHLMYDQHFEAQVALVDSIAERIQVLGGISLAMAADIAEVTKVPRLPRGREPAAVQLSRLIDAHTMIIKEARESADKASEAGDSGTDDLLVSEVVRTNELQVWFLSEHLVAASPV